MNEVHSHSVLQSPIVVKEKWVDFADYVGMDSYL
jgi:hypothetical protein